MADPFSGAVGPGQAPSGSGHRVGGMSFPGSRSFVKGGSSASSGLVPTLSSAWAGWTGLALEAYSLPASVISRHEHFENFLHVILSGSGKYEVLPGGRPLRFDATPGATFLLLEGPSTRSGGWDPPSRRRRNPADPLALRVERRRACGEVELAEHWDLIDPHISSILVAMTTDLDDGSPAGKLTVSRWPMRWQCISSGAMQSGASRPTPTGEACLDTVSSA